MLKHNLLEPSQPNRAVILGASGFVGGAAMKAFNKEDTKVLALGRAEIDLLDPSAGSIIAAHLEPTDTLVVVSAEAPCKDAAMLIRNVQMMISVCAAIIKVQPAHVIYISSDAVYADSVEALNESSCAEPGSIHGSMHLTREIMLKEASDSPIAILRPTLVYGINDPHNGYGPNRFRRLAVANEEIILFGEGEEQRDHILVEDVAELIRLSAWHKSSGILNAATGTVTSFKEVAEMVISQFDSSSAITGSPRIGNMPHNGYRAFDPAATFAAFPSFEYVSLNNGLLSLKDDH
jgi:UDP-glucose 4-epimerase